MEQPDKYTDFVSFIPKGPVMFYRMEQVEVNGTQSYLEMGGGMGLGGWDGENGTLTQTGLVANSFVGLELL